MFTVLTQIVFEHNLCILPLSWNMVRAGMDRLAEDGDFTTAGQERFDRSVAEYRDTCLPCQGLEHRSLYESAASDVTAAAA